MGKPIVALKLLLDKETLRFYWWMRSNMVSCMSVTYITPLDAIYALVNNEVEWDEAIVGDGVGSDKAPVSDRSDETRVGDSAVGTTSN